VRRVNAVFSCLLKWSGRGSRRKCTRVNDESTFLVLKAQAVPGYRGAGGTPSMVMKPKKSG